MTNMTYQWHESVVQWLTLASQLEGEGQYNLAKLLRAAVESVLRQQAYAATLPTNQKQLLQKLDAAATAMKALDFTPALSTAVERGIEAMMAGRLPLIGETPHPYVCRSCGHTVLEAPPERCPRCGARGITFIEFLPNFWFTALRPTEALQTLRETPTKVARFIEGVPESTLSRSPADSGWSIRNIVSHLRDAQGVCEFRVNLILEQENPRLESKAVFEWAAREEERPSTTDEIFHTYRESRERTVARLERLDPDEWQRTGEHEEFGTITLAQQVSYFATHEVTHLPQLDALQASAE